MARSDKSSKKLSAEDIEIWLRIADTASPLSKEDKNFANLFDSTHQAGSKTPPRPPEPKKPNPPPMPSYQPVLQTSSAPMLDKIDLKSARNISKGKTSIDGRLDLHGLTQQAAYRALFDCVENAYYSGKRTILVITGKGNLGRGVLRENVPKWLAQAPFHRLISAYSQSHSTHGGAGALYIRIRRKHK